MSAQDEPLPEGLVDDLLRPSGFPLDPDAKSGVEHIQTHLSHVLLLASRVYKLRKAVDLGFVCFSTRAQRNADCVNEVRLNRRLAAEVYLGVATVEPSGQGYTVGPLIEDPQELDAGLEHCVVMQRLEADRDTLSLLEQGVLTKQHLARVARKIARFHAGLAPITRAGAGEIAGPSEANLRAIESAGDAIVAAPTAAALRSATANRLAALAPTFARRLREGRVVEGHGDLHLQHVWFPGDGTTQDDPPIIDCLEFSESLRVTDVAAEVAFLAMDLAYRGRGHLAEGFLCDYVLETDDYDLYSVIDFYIAHRAAVRAKVAALAARDREIDAAQREGAARSAKRHVDFAARALEPRAPGEVLLVGGVIGTGKSTLARALVDLTGAVHVASDRVRKARLGLAPDERLEAEAGEGAYAPERRAEVYQEMLERAACVVASGRTVVLDATWSSRTMRERARAFAAARGARCVFIETCCDVDVLRARLALRKARGDDPSDAGPELLDQSVRGFEALDGDAPWPPGARGALQTDRDDIDAQLDALVETLELRTETVWG